MEPVFIDLHIHTSDNPDSLNQHYDLDTLKYKIEEIAEGLPYLLSLTDHNTINKPVYLHAIQKFEHILLGIELHVRNYDLQKPYHCHVFFNLKEIDEPTIDGINAILDELYPQKVVSVGDESIPRLEEIMRRFYPK